jgi:hypothetical protein
MKNPLCILELYFPGQKLEKACPPKIKTFYAIFSKKGICDKIFCFKEIVLFPMFALGLLNLFPSAAWDL